MFFIFDNMTAMVIGATVLLMLVATQMRFSQMNVEQTATYMMKNQAANMATWLEEDMLDLGKHIDKTLEVPFENPIDSLGVTTQFIFYRDSVNTAVSPPDTVRISTRYDLNAVGTYHLSGDSIKIYQLVRNVKVGTGSWAQAGGSVPLISTFKIDLLNADAQSVANAKAAMAADPTAIRNTRIRFSMVAPFEGSKAALRRIFYGSTLLIGS